jgi:hypothetical protein
MPTDLHIGSIPFILEDGYPVIIPVDIESGDLRGGRTGDDKSRPPLTTFSVVALAYVEA